MNLNEIEAQGFILALFIRDDGERFLLGTGAYQFLDSQLHFTANSFANDVVEVQGNDGVFFAGQVRRANTQAFDGYIGDADTPREDIENYRRQFIAFFRKNYYYTVVYVFNNGSAIKRQKGFIVDAPEVKELYQIYPQYHIALNFEDVNYYQYNENDEGIEQFGKSATITLAEDSNTGGLIWQQGSVVQPKIYGDTHQQTYTGKNLFSTVIEVGGISATGTSLNRQDRFNSRGFIEVAPSTTYTFSAIPGQAGKTLNVVFQAYTSGGVFIGQLPGDYFSTIPLTITTPSNCTKLTLSGRYTDDTSLGTVGSVTDAMQNCQLETGSTATSYEPYVGGVPAPSPDYPQPITNITGNIVLGNGKNLWPTQVYKTDYYISSTGVETYGAGTSIYGNITVKPNTEYTISLDTSQYATLRVHAYDSNGNWIEQIIAQSISSANKSATFTTPNNITYLRWSYYTNITDGQLELGSIATTYEPFKNYIIELGSTELCKIGAYQDYIYKDSNDDWYVHKETGKIVINGTENWDRIQYTVTQVYYRWYNSISTEDGFCNYLDVVPTSESIVSVENSIRANGNFIGIRFTPSFQPSIDDFKTWLSNHNLDFYYILVTSTDTKITDNTLIGQLNAWASSLTTTGGVEWDNIGAVWEIGGSGGPVNVTIDSIDNVYPIWEVTGPATNPEIEIIESNTSIKYTGSIGADEKLVVDMLNKTALVNGVSMIGNISGVWCYLKPGNNKVTYTTDNAGAMPSKLLWQEVVG